MELSEKISQLRKANHLSQEQLANELGISRQSVSKWETGDSTPDADKIWKLAEVFNVTTDYLLRPDAVNELEIKTTRLEIQQQAILSQQRRVECRQFADWIDGISGCILYWTFLLSDMEYERNSE